MAQRVDGEAIDGAAGLLPQRPIDSKVAFLLLHRNQRRIDRRHLHQRLTDSLAQCRPLSPLSSAVKDSMVHRTDGEAIDGTCGGRLPSSFDGKRSTGWPAVSPLSSGVKYLEVCRAVTHRMDEEFEGKEAYLRDQQTFDLLHRLIDDQKKIKASARRLPQFNVAVDLRRLQRPIDDAACKIEHLQVEEMSPEEYRFYKK